MAGMGEITDPPLRIAQNPSNSFTLQQMPEPPVSPINPGALPGSTAAIGGSATDTNAISGLPTTAQARLRPAALARIARHQFRPAARHQQDVRPNSGRRTALHQHLRFTVEPSAY